MTKPFIFLLVIFATALVILTGSAIGMNTQTESQSLCASDFGGYSNYSERYVVDLYGYGPVFSYTNESDWDAGQPYYARRHYDDQDRSLSYNHYVAYGSWPYVNSIDVWRTTSIKNANGASDTYGEEQYASGSC